MNVPELIPLITGAAGVVSVPVPGSESGSVSSVVSAVPVVEAKTPRSHVKSSPVPIVGAVSPAHLMNIFSIVISIGTIQQPALLVRAEVGSVKITCLMFVVEDDPGLKAIPDTYCDGLAHLTAPVASLETSASPAVGNPPPPPTAVVSSIEARLLRRDFLCLE